MKCKHLKLDLVLGDGVYCEAKKCMSRNKSKCHAYRGYDPKPRLPRKHYSYDQFLAEMDAKQPGYRAKVERGAVQLVKWHERAEAKDALRRVRRKVRREAGPYTQISAVQVVAWLNEEIKAVNAKGRN
jgi:hypothetical protein